MRWFTRDLVIKKRVLSTTGERGSGATEGTRRLPAAQYHIWLRKLTICAIGGELAAVAGRGGPIANLIYTQRASNADIPREVLELRRCAAEPRLCNSDIIYLFNRTI